MTDAPTLLRDVYGDEPATGYLKSPMAPVNPWWVEQPEPKPRAELRSYDPGASRDPQATRPQDWAERSGVGQGAGLAPLRAGADLGTLIGEIAHDAAEHNLSGLADKAPAAVGAVSLRRGATRPAMTLEQFVDNLKARPSVLNYDKYLEDPFRVVNGRSRQFETQEPVFVHNTPQRSKDLQHYRTMDSLREKRDAGLLEGPDGTPVNPWYWPAPTYHAFEKELGPELANDRLSKFYGYNAATSMQTRVPRNIMEGWNLLYHDLNERPFKHLGTDELTGAAYNNKLLLAGDVGEGRGFTSKTGPKVRNYDLNLHGVGTAEPEYSPSTGMLLTQPTTLDSIMAEAMRLKNDSGSPAKRFVGPMYRSGVDTINKLGSEVGAAPADTQAAIWQTHQFGKHGQAVYGDPWARTFDDMIHIVANKKGEDPQKTLADMIHGRERPPNDVYTTADMLAKAYGKE